MEYWWYLFAFFVGWHKLVTGLECEFPATRMKQMALLDTGGQYRIKCGLSPILRFGMMVNFGAIKSVQKSSIGVCLFPSYRALILL